jgi:hypothetical protein
MTRIRLIRVLVIALLYGAAAAAPAAAQNLLTNPGFDSDLSGWDDNSGSGTFDATRDADGSPTSGSVRKLQNVTANNTAPFMVRQCVTAGVVDDAAYNLGARIRMNQAPAGGETRIGFSFHGNLTCQFDVLAGGELLTSTASSAWQLVSHSPIAPPGTQSISIFIDFRAGGTGGDFEVNADNVFIERAAVVPTLSLQWMLALAVLLAGIAIASRRLQWFGAGRRTA